MSSHSAEKVHNSGPAFTPNPRSLITAFLLGTCCPQPDSIAELSLSVVRHYPPVLFSLVDICAKICYIAFLLHFFLCFGFRGACVVGYSTIGMWSVVASIARKHESILSDIIWLALPTIFFFLQCAALAVMLQQVHGHWTRRSVLSFYVVFFVGIFSGGFIPKAFPEWASEAFGLMSFTVATLLSTVFPDGTVSEIPLEVGDWGLLGGSVAVLCAHTLWLIAYDNLRTRIARVALSVMFFTTCGFNILNFLCEFKRGRNELWKIRGAGILDLWKQEPTQGISESDEEPELASQPSIV